jgi:hypothetical protein
MSPTPVPPPSPQYGPGRIGGIAGRVAHPARPDLPLPGGPQRSWAAANVPMIK